MPNVPLKNHKEPFALQTSIGRLDFAETLKPRLTASLLTLLLLKANSEPRITLNLNPKPYIDKLVCHRLHTHTHCNVHIGMSCTRGKRVSRKLNTAQLVVNVTASHVWLYFKPGMIVTAQQSYSSACFKYQSQSVKPQQCNSLRCSPSCKHHLHYQQMPLKVS